MSENNNIPIYNLNAVLKETGLKADVLRAWERRYGLPQPRRSAGGHRLYSQFDIETVKWLHARQKHGLSISRAVELWKEIVESGGDPLARNFPAAPSQAGAFAQKENSIETLRSQWVDACLNFDSQKAEETLTQAFSIYPVEQVCLTLLQQALNQIGDLWFSGKASVQQEHFASTLAIRRLDALLLATPNPTRDKTILAACPPDEQHTIPVLMLSLLLRRRGYQVHFLGADVPLEQLEETARRINPDLVIFAAQHLSSAATLSAAIQALGSMRIPLAYGGLIFNRVPALRERIPAWFLGESIGESARRAEELVEARQIYQGTVEADLVYQQTTRLFQERRPLIDMNLAGELSSAGIEPGYIQAANNFFGKNLAAAVALGNPSFVEPDLEWIGKLLSGWHVSTGYLADYLLLYSQVVQDVLGEKGRIITHWLDSYISTH